MVIADPCKQVRCRSRAALTDWYQDGPLALLDEAACHPDSSREELALALVDKGRHAPTRTSTELIHVRRATYCRGFEEEAPPVGRLFDRLLDP